MNNSNSIDIRNILDFDYKNKSLLEYKKISFQGKKNKEARDNDMLSRALKYSFYQKSKEKLTLNKNNKLSDNNIKYLYDIIYKNKDITFDCNQLVFLKIYHIFYVKMIYQRVAVMNLKHEIMKYKILLNYLDVTVESDKSKDYNLRSIYEKEITLLEEDIIKRNRLIEDYKNIEESEDFEKFQKKKLEEIENFKILLDEESSFLENKFNTTFSKKVNDNFNIERFNINKYEDLGKINKLLDKDFKALKNNNVITNFSLVSFDEDKKWKKFSNDFIYEKIINFNYVEDKKPPLECIPTIKSLEKEVSDIISNIKINLYYLLLKSRDFLRRISKSCIPSILEEIDINLITEDNISSISNNFNNISIELSKKISDELIYLVEEGFNYDKIPLFKSAFKTNIKLNDDLIDDDFYDKLSKFSMIKKKYEDFFKKDDDKATKQYKSVMKNISKKKANELVLNKLQYIYNILKGKYANHTKFALNNLPNIDFDYWVGKYMKDNKFRIVETLSNGNCFFDSIYKAIFLPIKEQRKIISDKLTEENFKTFKKLQDEDPEQYFFMEKIDNLNDLKTFVLTKEFWAEDLSITILQNKFCFNIILFDEFIYKKEKEASKPLDVVSCKKFDSCESNSNTKPKYIMLAYNGNHYQLVSYENKRIFTKEKINVMFPSNNFKCFNSDNSDISESFKKGGFKKTKKNQITLSSKNKSKKIKKYLL